MAPQVPITARLDADSFPHPLTHLAVRETPISWVLLTGPYAYKIKKPVHFSFIDASTLPRRQFLCEEELRLNRRFAPELYLDVLPIGEGDGHLRIGGRGAVVEYTVRMRQFEASEELAPQLASGGVGTEDLRAFGQRLAEWHQGAPRATAEEPYGSPELVRSHALENFEPIRRCVQGEDIERASRLEHWTREELNRLAALIEQRRHSGQVRECHGDLHAGNIVRWRGRWLPFDCLEFEPRLRWIDVIGDVAFLYMDLMARGHEELAYAFLSAYLEESGDYEGLRLLPLYSVYRALVRAKVDALSIAADSLATSAPEALAPASRERLRGRLKIAERLAFNRAPALLLMHGVSGSGKSCLSTQLIGALGAVRVRSDLERTRLFGAGAYSPAATEATYERLHSCALSALESGHRIIVDATFLQRTQRQAFEQLALRHGFPPVILSCHAPRSTLETRVSQRMDRAQDPSEATSEVLDAQLKAFNALVDEERVWLIEVDTASPQAFADAVDAVRPRLRSAVWSSFER